MPAAGVPQGVEGVDGAIYYFYRYQSVQPSRAPHIGYESPLPSPQKPLSHHPLRKAVMVRTAGRGQEAWDPPETWDIQNSPSPQWHMFPVRGLVP